MKYIKIIVIIFVFNILFSGFVKADQNNEEFPIMFVHGNKAEGTVEKGWTT